MRGFFSFGLKMIRSICCKADVFVESCNEGTAYYVCRNCLMACDTVFMTQRKEKEHGYLLSGSGISSAE